MRGVRVYVCTAYTVSSAIMACTTLRAQTCLGNLNRDILYTWHLHARILAIRPFGARAGGPDSMPRSDRRADDLKMDSRARARSGDS